MIVKNILIIEDDALVASSIMHVLKDTGLYHIDLASDSNEGLMMLKHATYDLTIVDNHLPGEKGYEIMRKMPRNKFIVCSAEITHNNELLATYKALPNYAGYLAKPPSLEAVLKSVSDALEGR